MKPYLQQLNDAIAEARAARAAAEARVQAQLEWQAEHDALVKKIKAALPSGVVFQPAHETQSPHDKVAWLRFGGFLRGEVQSVVKVADLRDLARELGIEVTLEAYPGDRAELDDDGGPF